MYIGRASRDADIRAHIARMRGDRVDTCYYKSYPGGGGGLNRLCKSRAKLTRTGKMSTLVSVNIIRTSYTPAAAAVFTAPACPPYIYIHIHLYTDMQSGGEKSAGATWKVLYSSGGNVLPGVPLSPRVPGSTIPGFNSSPGFPVSRTPEFRLP